MSLERLEIPAGVVKSNTPYTQRGRYVDAQWVRFQGGLPEKRGGRSQLTASTLTGLCRGVHQWRDNTGYIYLGMGTHKKLYVFYNATLVDVTPLRQINSGTLTDPITTTNGSATVSIADTAHGLALNDWVVLTAASAVGGLTIAGVYLVNGITDADNYTIDAISQATSSAGPGGGSVSYTYYHKLLGSNPFATTSGSSVVTVTATAHGALEGDTVIISGSSAVGGVTPNGTFTILNATANAYTIDVGSAASSTTTGGGAAVRVKYEINVGMPSNADLFGYGLGLYGAGTYGTPRTSSIPGYLRTWSVKSYGQWMLANPSGGALYKWDPTYQSNVRAVELYGAPSSMLAMFVTPERFIIALGASGDALQIAWNDQTDPNQWTAAEGNTANSGRKVQGGSRLFAGLPVRNGVNLLWGDAAAFTHQYRTDDYVFTTAPLGFNTGIFGPNAATVVGDVAYWVGDGAFWKWDGSATQLKSDDIREWFFANIDRSQRAKCFMGSIASKNELIILYQESGQSEINRALIYNLADEVWTPCTVDETAWLDRQLWANPIGIDASGNVLYEETGTDDYDASVIDSYIEAGPIDLQNGDVNLDIFGWWPDIYNQAGALSLYVRIREENTQDSITTSGPFTIATTGDHIDLRESGKLAGFKLESNVVGGNWRMGVNRAEVQPAGSR